MPDVQDKHAGTRIREIRLIRDYTLAQLSQRSHVSTSQLSRVENGEQPPSPSVLAAVARALGVTLSVLHGQPYVHMLQKDQLDRLLAPISSALDTWDIPPDDDMPQDSLDAVAGRVSALSRLRAKGEFAQVAEGLPEAIAATTLAVQTHTAPGATRERAHYLQAEVARTTAILAYRLGYMDLARLALARMAAAAPHSGDPRQVAVERYERAVITHAETSRPDRGVALVKQALRDLEEDGDPQTSAVRGTLLLRASALSAVQQKKSAASDWLEQAAEVVAAGERADAAQDPPGTRYALAFGELNVSLGRLDVALLQDDHETAVRVASEVRLPTTYQPTRAAGFLIRKAAAEAWTARHDAALDSLLQARQAAPQLTRYHPDVHQTVGTLLRARQRAADPLRQFAEWSGE
ncbi:helix-turn-helix domain-containing protein [Streptomyces buecherae]|uniref:helix-turn-helix domain-containing protein n=1 Tax=Streptomyces buecherae TaxID=2763006 RepID=UPI001C26F165|nr:helix-turn-helix transcriptional regulator [Streptomyces buecherae]